MSQEYCSRASTAQRARAENIHVFSLKAGEYIKTVGSAYDAAEFVDPALDNKRKKIVAGRIWAVCKANKGHAYGYIWRSESKHSTERLSQSELLIEQLPAHKKTVLQFSIDGILLAKYVSAAEAARQIAGELPKKKLRHIAQTINQACQETSERYAKYRGFVWKYEEEPKTNVNEVV